ncbi:MAG: GNAT family N-acetyltransferase, partial [Eubacterium sp.]|nr:GNAT family N-acetyltransferase [Eubacterium sp.]
LETNPKYRKKGYGRELLFQLQRYLKEHNKSYVLTAHVEKTNTPSLKTHKSAGFEITADYVIEDGERFNTDYQLTYIQ